MPEPVFVVITCRDEEEAATIARALVSERLAAGANILPVSRSIYQWKGELCEHSEALMLIESEASRFEALRQRALALHSYECPKIVMLPIAQGHRPYLKWLVETLGSDSAN